MKSQSWKVYFQAVLDSKVLGNSPNQINLFKYLLEQSSKGDAAKLGPHAIAHEALNRNEEFDPAVDAIVRVEMHRLRKNLQTFNGIQDKYKISIPFGDYVVKVEETKEPNEKARSTKKTAFIVVALVAFMGLIYMFHRGDTMNSVIASFNPSLPKNSVPTDFIPKIYIEVNNNDDAEYLKSEILAANSLRINFFFTNEPNRADYIMNISIFKVPHDEDISIRVTNKVGEVIVQKFFKSSNANGYTITENLFDLSGSDIIHDFLINPVYAGQRQDIYRCYIDADKSLWGMRMQFFTPDQLMDCLSLQYDGMDKELQALLKIRKASVLIDIYRDRLPIDYDKDIARADAEKLLDEAYSDLGLNNRIQYRKLLLLWAIPGTTPEEYESFIEKMDDQHPNDMDINYLKTATYVYFIGDFEKAETLYQNSNLDNTHSDSTRLVEIPIYMSKGDIEKAKAIADELVGRNGKTFLALSVPLACATQDPEATAYNDKLATELNVDGFNFSDFLDTLNWHERLTDMLIQYAEPCV